MNVELVNQIANAVLYEGYILYPYRRSALKNQQRWNFGVLYPPAYAVAQTGHDASSMQVECLALINPETCLTVSVRFLHLIQRDVGRTKSHTDEFLCEKVEALQVGSQRFESWQETCEREAGLSTVKIHEPREFERILPFAFTAGQTRELLSDEDRVVGVIVRSHETVNGEIHVVTERQSDSLCKIRVTVSNCSECDGHENSRERALLNSLLSAHAVLSLENGEFISLLDPPEEFRSSAAACSNIGCWPVLVGADDERDTMLASPIILYDYPQIAPQSSGNLFDGTEIDEILSLRIMALTEAEKHEMQTSDARAAQILKRTEALPVEQFMKLHGVLKTLNNE